MRRVLFGAGAVVALVVAVQAAEPAPQQRQVQSDQEVLVELEQRWNAAFYRRDAAFIATVLADDFVATYDDGTRGDKATELALASAFAEQVESAVPDEFTVKEYGDTAIVRFTLHLVGLRQGQRAETQLRYTDVWIIRDGRWLCVSSHSTRIASAILNASPPRRFEAGSSRPIPRILSMVGMLVHRCA